MPSKSHPAGVPGGASELGAITRSEIGFLCCFTIALALLTSLPYTVARLASRPGTIFAGVIEHSLDTNNYLAYIHQSSTGSWLFHNPMTGEPHGAVFFNLEWLVAGKIAQLFRLQPASAMDVCRLLSLGLLCIATYWLASFLFKSVLMRRIATVACLGGGGFGWITVVHLLHIRLDSSYFLDLTNANLFPFYWELRLAHFLIAETFIVLGLCFFLLAESNGKPRHYIAAGACYLVAGACRPYDMVFVMTATTLFLAWEYWRRANPISPLWLRSVPVWICFPLLGYYYWVFKIHPVFRWWSVAGNPAPPAWLLALSFGPSFCLLPLIVWRIRRESISNAGLFMASCFVSAVVLAQMHWLFHFAFQFATNILIPMVMLVVLGLENPVTRFARRSGVVGIAAILFVNSFTSIALVGQAVVLAVHGEYRTSTDLTAAYSWLNANSQPSDVILADLDISNAMPQYIAARVFCGYSNAVRADDKLREMRDFFNPQTTSQFREDLIRQNAIGFVVLTGAEIRDLDSLLRDPLVQEVFRNNSVVILARNNP
jgi:hypothetical protein